MKIVINASPEKLFSIVYYDGIGNQIYPPHNLEKENLINYINGVSDERDIQDILVVGPKSYTKKIAEEIKDNFKTVNVTILD